MPSPGWDRSQVDFNERGELIIKNEALSRRLAEVIGAGGDIPVKLQPWPVEPSNPDDVCGIGPVPLNPVCVCREVDRRPIIVPPRPTGPAGPTPDAPATDPSV